MSAEAAATRLELLAAHLHKTDLALLLSDAASIVRSRTQQGTQIGTAANPTHGIATTNPMWTALIPVPETSRAAGGDWLRLLMLLNTLLDDCPIGLQPSIGAFDRWRDSAAILQINDQLAAFIKAPKAAMGDTLSQWVSAASKQLSLSQTQSQLLLKTTRSFLEKYANVVIRLDRQPVTIVSPNPVDDGSSSLPIASVDHADEVSEDQQLDFIAAPEERERGNRNERNAIRRSVHLYATCLGRSSASALLVEESQVLVERLVENATNAANEEDLCGLSIWLTWLLMLVTSRAMDTILTTNLSEEPSDSKFAINPVAGTWRSEITAKANLNVPAPESLKAPTLKYCDFPLPHPVTALLGRWRELAGPEHQRLRGAFRDSGVLSKQVEDSRAHLKTHLPLVSDARIRLTLPVLIHEHSQEPCFAVIQSGKLLGYSTAPLHYFYSEASTIIAHYDAALNLVGLPLDAVEPDRRLIGADLAAISTATIKSYQRRLAGRTLRSKHRTTLVDRIASYNECIKYTGRMIGAGVGHRQNNNIGALSLASIDPRGWGTIDDKAVESGASIRPTVFAPTLIRQLENVRLLQSDLLPDLPKKIRKKLRDALEGRGPLLVLIRHSIEQGASKDAAQISDATPLTSSDLQDPWLDERNLPRWFLRSRLRAGLQELGVPPHLIYFQMGQTYNGMSGAGIESPLAIEDAAAALRDKINLHLEQDGWTALPLSATNRTPLRTWVPDTPPAKLRDERAAFEKRWVTAWKTRRKAELGEARNPAHIEQRSNWLENCFSEFRSEVTNAIYADIRLQDYHIEKWLDSLSELKLARPAAIDCLRHLRNRVIELRRTAGWSGQLPPLLFDKGPSTPHVTYHHVIAGRQIENLRLSILGDAPAHLTDSLSRWARVAGLLMTGFCVLNESQLQQALDALLRKNVVRPDPDHLLTEIRVSEKRSQTVRLTKAATLAYAAAHELTVPPPTISEILDALKSWMGKTLKHPLRSWFDIQKLAVRICRPGVLWGLYESEDRNTLTLDRTMLFLSDSVGGPPLAEAEEPETLTDTEPHPIRPPDQRIAQYKAFRSGINALREPNDSSQGVDHARYRKALRLCNETLSQEALDDTVAGLVEFGESLFRRRGDLRISTTYDYLTGLGMPLLRALEDESLFDLEEDRLEEIATAILDATPDSRRSGVASRLMQFFRFHESSLGVIDPSWLEEHLGDQEGPRLASHSHIVTEAEFQALQTVLKHLGDQNRLSDHEITLAKVAASLMYRLGIRAGEATHRLLSDVMHIKGVYFLYIHTTPLGFVKTRNAVRLLNLSRFLPSDELERFQDFYKSALEENPDSSQRKSPPLFLTTLPGESATGFDARKNAFRDMLKLIRSALSVVTGLPYPSLHLLRHSAATRLVIDHRFNADGRDLDPSLMLDVPRAIGHGSGETTFRFYWHLDHLTPFYEQPLTISQQATLEGKTASAVKKQRQRSKANSISDMPTPVASPSESDKIDQLAFALSKNLASAPHDFLNFLVRTERRMSAVRALRNLRCSSEIIARYLQSLMDVEKECRMTFMRERSDPWILKHLHDDRVEQPKAATKQAVGTTPRNLTTVPSRHELKSFSILSKRFAELQKYSDADARKLLGVARRDLQNPSRPEAKAMSLLKWSKACEHINTDCWLLAIHVASQAPPYHTDSSAAN